MQNSKSEFDSDGDHNTWSANNNGHNFLQNLREGKFRDVKVRINNAAGNKTNRWIVGASLVAVIILGVVVAVIWPKINNSGEIQPSKTYSTSQSSTHTSLPSSPLIVPTADSTASQSSTDTPSQTLFPSIMSLSTTPYQESLSSSVAPIITTSIPTPSTTLALPSAETKAPLELTAGDFCTDDSECGLNVCYKGEPDAPPFCCDPSIAGCPGSPCTESNCKSPFGCNLEKQACCGYPRGVEDYLNC